MRRRLLTIAVFPLAGAAVNVAVAWSCARWASPRISGWGNYEQGGEPWAIDVQSSFGFDVFGLTSRSRVQSPGSRLRERRLPRWATVPRYASDVADQMVYVLAGWPLRCLGSQTRPRVDPTPSAIEQLHGHWRQSIVLDRGSGWFYGSYVLPYRPLWLGLLANTLFFTMLLWLLAVGPFFLRRRLRIRRGLCPKCAYPMGESALCTECGTELTRRRLNAQQATAVD